MTGGVYGGILAEGPLDIVGGRDLLECGLHAPDLAGILGDGAITGELSRASDVVDHLLGPFFGVLVRRRHGTYQFNISTFVI